MPGGDVNGVPVLGLVGKLPAHGDFVRRGGPAAVLAQVDAWLDHELGGAAAAGIMLDDAVEALDGWRFATHGAGGPVIAVAVASGDGVGRVFPLVATLAGVAVARGEAETWCAAAADAIAAVRDAGQGADAALAALAAIEPPGGAGPATSGWWHPGEDVAAGEAADLPTGDAFRLLLSRSEP
jgi:type VI secretion system protein ImpM